MKPHGRAVRPLIPASAAAAFAGVLFLAPTRPAPATEAPALIPAPVHLQLGEGAFEFTAQTRIVYDPVLEGGRELAEYARAELSRSTGLPLDARPMESAAAQDNALVFSASGTTNEAGREGYTLEVTPRAVRITAAASPGAFYGFQTLRQLLPAESYGTNRAEGVAWRAPAVTVSDKPRFAWRGYMLDVVRRYFDKDAVKRLIDALAMHKFNILHLHLTDLNAWRLEIEKYPLLTSPETTRAHYQGPHRTYFTKADIRDLVDYARARHITVVPEIDMPGHSRAAVAAYPEFGESGTLNPGYPGTYAFLKDILAEVIALFPSPYVHMGADEARLPASLPGRPDVQAFMAQHGLTTLKDLEGHFDRVMTDFIVEQGKVPCGWEEAGDFDLDPSFIAFWWMGGHIKKALAKGYRVVACLYSYAYWSQAEDLGEYGTVNYEAPPLLTARRVYDWEPAEGLSDREAGQLLGVQACLWTPLLTFESNRLMEYKTFPRLAALADVAWGPKGARGDYAEFSRRLARQLERYRQMGLYYRTPVDLIRIGDWKPGRGHDGREPLLLDITPHLKDTQTVGVVFHMPDDATSWDKIQTVELLEDDRVVAASRRLYFYSYPSGMLKNHVYTLEVNPYREGATYRVRAAARPGLAFEAAVYLRPFVQPETYSTNWTCWPSQYAYIQHVEPDSPAGAGSNLLRNASFEEDLSAPYIDFWCADWPPSIAVADDAHAWDGARSACLQPRDSCSFGMTYRYATNLERDKDYTFSLWAKAEQTNSVLLLFAGPAGAEPRGVGRVARVGTDWQRLEWTFRLPAGLETGENRIQIGMINPGFYYPEWETGVLDRPRSRKAGQEEDQIAVTPKNGRIWVDAAQLELGGAATPYKPGPPSRAAAP